MTGDLAITKDFKMSVVGVYIDELSINVQVEISPGIILDQPRTNCNKRFFADFTSKGTLEHYIKNVSKSTLGKSLKIVVLKNWVSYLHGKEACNKLLTFKSDCQRKPGR